MASSPYTEPDASLPDDEIYIGFDTEWCRNTKLKTTNDILAYALVVICGDRVFEYYAEPVDSAKKRMRKTFRRLLGDALQGALQAGVIARWPHKVTVATHFGRGDLAACADFKAMRDKMSAVKGTLVTGRCPVNFEFDIDDKTGRLVDDLPAMPRKLRVNATDESNNQHVVDVRFVDTFNLTPAGYGSLATIGELIGFQKIELPAGYSAADMRRFKEEKPVQFKKYLNRDALITAVYARRWAGFSRQTLGLKEAPGTLGGAAVAYQRLLWKDEGVDRQGLLGLETHISRSYSKVTGKIRLTKSEEMTFERCLTELAGTKSYRGGWTETYLTGPVTAPEGGCLRDIDLRSAYPSAMAALGVPDFSSIRIVGPGSVEAFTAETLGFAEISFDIPRSIRFPGLAVPTEAGLLFPRRGKTIVTAPEIAAALSMGVALTVHMGFILDCDRDTRPWLGFVVRLAKLRAKLKVGGRDAFESLLAKTIANSLYGKLGQGVHARATYDPRTGGSKQLPPSGVTQPLFAAFTTGLVRAAIFEMLNSLPAGRMVVSVSTDGFLTDAEIDEVSVAGPAAQVLLEARRQIADGSAV
jgi:hypothetical protein